MSVNDISEPYGNSTSLSPSTQPPTAAAAPTEPSTAGLVSQSQIKEVCFERRFPFVYNVLSIFCSLSVSMGVLQ